MQIIIIDAMFMPIKKETGQIKQRVFTESDLPQIIELRRQGTKISFPGRKFDEKKFAERLLRGAKKNPEWIQIIEKDGEIIGYVWFGLREGDVGKYGFLSQLFIREDFRKKGLAQKLLGHAEKYLASKGAKSMRLMVTDTNCSAVEFYEKMDYRKTRFLMEKRL